MITVLHGGRCYGRFQYYEEGEVFLETNGWVLSPPPGITEYLLLTEDGRILSALLTIDAYFEDRVLDASLLPSISKVPS